MKKAFLKISGNSQENIFGLRNFQKRLFYRTPLDDCFLLKWDTASSVWKTSDKNIHYLETLTQFTKSHTNASVFNIQFSKLYLHLLTLFLTKDYVSYIKKLASF